MDTDQKRAARQTKNPPAILTIAAILGIITIWAAQGGNDALAWLAGVLGTLCVAMWAAAAYIRQDR